MVVKRVDYDGESGRVTITFHPPGRLEVGGSGLFLDPKNDIVSRLRSVMPPAFKSWMTTSGQRQLCHPSGVGR